MSAIRSALGGLSDFTGINLDPQKPYDDLSRVIQGAADQTRQFSDLQWQRQMEGLNRALGATNNYRATYDKIYGTNSARPQQVDPMAMGLPPPPGGGPGGAGGQVPGAWDTMMARSQPVFAPPVRGTATGNYSGPMATGNRAIPNLGDPNMGGRALPTIVNDPNAAFTPSIAPTVRGTSTGAYTGPAPVDGRAIPSRARQSGIDYLNRAYGGPGAPVPGPVPR